MSLIEDLIKEDYIPCLYGLGIYKKQNEEKIIQFFNDLKNECDKYIEELSEVSENI